MRMLDYNGSKWQTKADGFQTPKAVWTSVICGDSVSTVSVRNRGVLFCGVAAKQEHLFAVEGIFGPDDVR